jgi:hypothetical protein
MTLSLEEFGEERAGRADSQDKDTHGRASLPQLMHEAA